MDGGYRVSGRWSLGSGCTHADVIIGGCLVTENGGKLSIFPRPPIPLRQRPHARVALAKAEMQRRAARAFTYDVDRLLRDAITMSQHLLLGDSYLEMIGGAILGEPAPHTGIL